MASRANPNPEKQRPETSRQLKPNEYETYIVIPPDGGWGWVVVFGAFFSYFLCDGLQYSFGIFIKDFAAEFQCAESKISLAQAINTCLFCVSSPVSAALINRFGYRAVSFSGSILASISCLLTSSSTSIYMVIGFHGVVGGIGFGMIYLTAVIVVGFYFEKWRAVATGIAVCGAGFGGICLPPLFTLLLAEVGWRHTFQVLSCMSICIMLFSSVFRQIKPTRILITTEPSQSNQPYKGPTIINNKVIDGKISMITIIEPKKMRVHSSEVLVNTINATNSRVLDRREIKRKRNCGYCYFCNCGNRKVAPTRPMNKDDIFYSGSLTNLPEYIKSSHSSKLESKSRSNLEYQLSITHYTSPESSTSKIENDKLKCCKTMNRTMAKMLDCKLLKSTKFVLLILNCIFMSFGFYIPFIFIKDASILRGMSPNIAYVFISTMGAANIFGRITCGLVSTIPGVKAICVAYCLLIMAGISTILSTLCYNMWMFFLYSATYGFCIAAMSALKTVIIVELLGLDNLTNAIGMILMFQGFATLVGVTIAGYLKDISGDYYWSFYSAGACICIAGLFLIVMNCID